MTDAGERVHRRRMLEALRAGVPSRDAVALLGSGQGELEDRAVALCDRLRDMPPAGPHPGGLLVTGGFGAGKSHALEHLAALALDNGFVVSRIVVSKETPLYDPARFFRAAVDTAVAPGSRAPVVADAVAALDPHSPAFTDLVRWSSSSRAELNERFPATLLLADRLRRRGGDEGELEPLVRFWSGDPLRVPDLRRALRDVGERPPSISAVPARELARQRLTFAAHLFVAAGHAGWLLLVDEVELIGRYSLLQRGRSYGEVARWCLGRHDDPALPATAVLAMTDDFAAAVLDGKSDRQALPGKLRGRQSAEWDAVAAESEAGMRVIDSDAVLLEPPDAAELDAAYRALKKLHGEAFDWAPPDVPGLERLGATRMRQHVRAWINEWDLVRLDPTYRPVTEAVQVSTSYQEDPELERELGDGN